MIDYKIHHVNGLYFELISDEGKNREYDISFLDRGNNNKSVYEIKMKIGTWARLERKYLSDIIVLVRYEGRTIKQINLLDEIKGKKVFISFESKALGDTLAWIPYCLKFAQDYNCKVVVSTFKNFLFEKVYPELEFVDRGVTVTNIVAMFEIGWYWDKYKEPVNPVLVSLQKSASNILHLEHEEIRPRIDFTPTEQSPIDGKYICISVHSTAQLKYWAWENWQGLIDHFVAKGYKVLEISNQETAELTNLTPLLDRSILNTMNVIHHSEFFVGLSSGLSWLSWTLQKKVYMIANFTEKDHEFVSGCVRIYDESVCHGCWNKEIFRFDKGSWLYCPIFESSENDHPRHFECHKAITLDTVLNIINNGRNN